MASIDSARNSASHAAGHLLEPVSVAAAFFGMRSERSTIPDILEPDWAVKHSHSFSLHPPEEWLERFKS